MEGDINEKKYLLSSTEEEIRYDPTVQNRSATIGIYNTVENGEKDRDLSISNIKTYKRRWYILVIFSMYGLTQNVVWAQWAPISTTAEEVFEWSDADIVWIANLGAIAYIVPGLFFPWLMQVKGMRGATLFSMLCIAVGCSLRVITSKPRPATILVYVCSFLNGVAGPVFNGITQLSAEWFAPKDRVAATAISYSILVGGSGIVFTLGPALVQSTAEANTNMTTPCPTMSPMISQTLDTETLSYVANQNTSERLKEESDNIMLYMYYSCGWAWLIMISLLLYFPSVPPSPPGITATLKRQNYWQGMWELRKNTNYLLLSLICSLSAGVQGSWTTLLNVNMKVLGISETTSGWIGFYAVVASCVSGLVVGKIAAHFNRSLKKIIFILLLMSVGCFTVLALMMDRLIAYSEVALWTCTIAGSAFANGTAPLLFEYSCEAAYPTGESAANGFLNWILNIISMLFFAIFAIPDIGTRWMNWALVGCIGVCLPLTMCVKNCFQRLEIDEGVSPNLLNQSIEVTSEKTDIPTSVQTK